MVQIQICQSLALENFARYLTDVNFNFFIYLKNKKEEDNNASFLTELLWGLNEISYVMGIGCLLEIVCSINGAWKKKRELFPPFLSASSSSFCLFQLVAAYEDGRERENSKKEVCAIYPHPFSVSRFLL